MPYYHGTATPLSPGTILVPGETIGITRNGRSTHVYVTHDDFSMSEIEDAPTSIRSAPEFARYDASVWGAFAADNVCNRHPSHFKVLRDNERDLNKGLDALSECVYLYEVEPLGTLEYDDAHDVQEGSARVAKARVLRRVTRIASERRKSPFG